MTMPKPGAMNAGNSRSVHDDSHRGMKVRIRDVRYEVIPDGYVRHCTVTVIHTRYFVNAVV